MEKQIDELSEGATARDAIAWLRHVVKAIGPGFHPDTRASDYIRCDDDAPLFTEREAARLDADVSRTIAILEVVGRDPYAVCGRVARRQLGMPFPV